MELFEGGIERGVTLAPVNTVADVLAGSSTSPPGTTGTTCCCRAGGRCARRGRSSRRPRTPIAWTRPAPDVGEHTREVLDALGVRSAGSTSVAPSRSSPRRPASAGGRQGRRLLVDRRRTDHGQGARRPRRHRRPRRERPPGRPTAPRRSVQGRHPRHQPLPVLRVVQHVEGVAAARPQAPGRQRDRPPAAPWCDIALDSFTAGTMDALGLGYDVARELNPGHHHGHDLPAWASTGRRPSWPATATTPPPSAGSTRSRAGTTGRRPVRSTPTPTRSRRAS